MIVVRISCFEVVIKTIPAFSLIFDDLTNNDNREKAESVLVGVNCMIHGVQQCEKSAIINTNLSTTRYKEQANLIDATKERNYCFLNGNSARCGFHSYFFGFLCNKNLRGSNSSVLLDSQGLA